MARGVNKVILLGRLGQDPETRYTQGGSAITNISIATEEQWKDKQTGENQKRTEWHNVKFFGRLAEIAGEYLKKGSQVYIEGSLRTEQWEDKDGGGKRYATKVYATEMQLLGGAGSGEGGQRNEGGDRGERSGGRQERPAERRDAPRGPPPPNDFEDDDIPF